MSFQPNIKFLSKLIFSVVEWSVFGSMLIIFFVVMSPLLPTKDVVATYIVPTGSMEPTIKTGSIVFVQPVNTESVHPGEIIAFRSPDNPRDTILHRVVTAKDEYGMKSYTTKGDNNTGPDKWTVDPSMIYGQLQFAVPYLGHPVSFIRTKEGYLLLVGGPSLIIMGMQVLKIKEGIEEELLKRKKRRYLFVPVADNCNQFHTIQL